MIAITEAEIKTAIRKTCSYHDFGLNRITVAGIMFWKDEGESVDFQVAIKHKELSDGCNASVYRITKTSLGPTFGAYNGSLKVSKTGKLIDCHDVHYGNFTAEIAKEMLSQIFATE